MRPELRRLLALVALAMGLAVVHHVDHVLRDAVGWPVNDELNPFTISLVVYPVVLLGFELTRRGVAGPAFWTVVTLASTIAVGVVHLTPSGPEPPGTVLDGYDSAAAGALALAVVAALIATLIVSTGYAAKLWARSRTAPRTA